MRAEVYDAWATAGNTGWTFADVVDDFRGLESDGDIEDEWHGTEGQVPMPASPGPMS